MNNRDVTLSRNWHCRPEFQILNELNIHHCSQIFGTKSELWLWNSIPFQLRTIHLNNFWMWILRSVFLVSSLWRVWRVWFMVKWIFCFYWNLKVTTHKRDFILISIYKSKIQCYFPEPSVPPKILKCQFLTLDSVWYIVQELWIVYIIVHEYYENHYSPNWSSERHLDEGKQPREYSWMDPNLWNWGQI